MTLRLSVECYKGVDGSSLSQTRCYQIVQVYEMLESMGRTHISYVDIQEEAESLRLFGDIKAKSAIRTFFPLLKKIGFVNYDENFAANSCFTELGTQFVLVCRALFNITDKTPNKDLVFNKLKSIKQRLQIKGLINMHNNLEYKNHNMWIALKLLKKFHKIHWNEFLYSLFCIDNGYSLDYAIEQIQVNKQAIDSCVFLNEDNKTLPNTCYSYIRSFLEESGLICKVSSQESELTEEAYLFLSIINL